MTTTLPSVGDGPVSGPAESPGQTSRELMRGCDRATLATTLAESTGWPYPSLVLSAVDHDGSPLLLISRLAEHTRNIGADDRVGLLFDATLGLEAPLAGARVSVLGNALPTDQPRHRARFLARHPSAMMYAGFGDFSFWRVEVTRAHLVRGFGRIHWIDAADLLLDTTAAVTLAACEPDIIGHMNADHADVVALIAERLLGRTPATPDGPAWGLTGIDPEGCDLRRGGEVARMRFDRFVTGPEDARAVLAGLAQRARIITSAA